MQFLTRYHAVLDISLHVSQCPLVDAVKLYALALSFRASEDPFYRWEFLGNFPQRFGDPRLVLDGPVDLDGFVCDVYGAGNEAEDRGTSFEAGHVLGVKLISRMVFVYH